MSQASLGLNELAEQTVILRRLVDELHSSAPVLALESERPLQIQ